VETFEVTSMVVAVGLMFAAVATKVITAQLLAHMRQQINLVAQMKAAALTRLQKVQNRKQVAEKNKTVLETRKAQLVKKMNRLRKELEDMKQEDMARRQRLDGRKVE